MDHYKVGTLNYHPHGKTIDWPKFARDVKQLLEDLGKPYYLKRVGWPSTARPWGITTKDCPSLTLGEVGLRGTSND
ncbi:unnamed protein product [marine sediment metagenome]|uniref:Uncharacterized protein n=1 Tax=marine sediment metagenome TaxID=412755 RepID=X1TUZ8_9ZZZZ